MVPIQKNIEIEDFPLFELFNKNPMDVEDSDSQCTITDLESDIYNVIQEIRNEQPPLEIRKDLYEVAYKHAQNCFKKLHHNVKEGFESRRNIFKDAKRYIEINFVTKPLDSEDPLSFISKILKGHYSSRIQSHIDSIGPVTMKLKSNKYIVIILGAFFKPIFSVRLFFQYFPKIREMNQSSTDFDALIDLMNHFRNMHNFKTLINNPLPPKPDSYKNILSKTVSYESKKASDLFCRLFTDQTYIDLIGEIWTDFSYSVEKGDSNSLLKMRFYRDDEEFQYTVDVHHPINKDRLDKVNPKYIISKDNDKINNINDSEVIEDNFGRENNTPISEQKDNNLSNEIEVALQILNDNDVNKVDNNKENELNSNYEVNDIQPSSPLKPKRSPWEKYEPTGSVIPQTTIFAQPKRIPSVKQEQRRNNSTSSLLFSKKIVDFDNGKINLSPKGSAWGNLKPSLKNIPSVQSNENFNQKEDEKDECKMNEVNNEIQNNQQFLERNAVNNNEESDEMLQGSDSEQNANKDYLSDSSDVFTIRSKQRSNSEIISLRDKERSPWNTISMNPSDKPFDEMEELKKIPTGLHNSKIKMQMNRPSSGLPTPSKITTPLSAMQSAKGWSSLRVGKPPIPNPLKKQQYLSPSQKDEFNENEIVHPQKQIIKRASNAWSLINPNVNQQNLSYDQIELKDPHSNTNETTKSCTFSENESEKEDNPESEIANQNNKKPLLLKGSHKAHISPLGQSLKKTSPNTVKKKQSIKTIPLKSKISDFSPTRKDDSK